MRRILERVQRAELFSTISRKLGVLSKEREVVDVESIVDDRPVVRDCVRGRNDDAEKIVVDVQLQEGVRTISK